MDTTLTQGVLDRLDALTSTMGVAATEVWSIWLATSWRPMLSAAFCFVFFLVFGIVALLNYRKYLRLEEVYQASSGAETAVTRAAVRRSEQSNIPAAVICGIISGVALLIFIFTEPTMSVAYLLDPRLYALDQLRALVGR